MQWTDEYRERLEVALTESEVCGFRHGRDSAVGVLLHVLSLQPERSMSPDSRRILWFHGVTRMEILLRRVTVDGDGPPVPLRDFDAVDEFFDSLALGGELYGWRYFDDPSLTDDWPSTSSLSVESGREPAPHTFYWFNECTMHSNGDVQSYCLEGTISFESLSVTDADDSPLHLSDFIADGVRWWQALHDSDDRADIDAQRAASSGPRWRDYPGIATTSD